MNKKFKNITLDDRQVRIIKYGLKEIVKKYSFVPQTMEEYKICYEKRRLEFMELYCSNEGSVFLKTDGRSLLSKIQEIMTNDSFIKENISNRTVYSEIYKLIGKYTINKKENKIEEEIDNLLSKFDNFEGKHKVTFIIEGMSLLDLKEFTIGKVIFRKIDNNIAKEFYNYDTNNAETEQEGLNSIINDRVKKIVGKTTAEFISSGDEEISREKTLFAIQQTINVLRFYYCWGNWYRALYNRNFQINVSGYQQGGSEDVIIEDLLSKKKTRFYGRGVSLLQTFEVSPEIFNKLKENRLDDFNKLLTQDKPGELEKALINSLYWIGEAINDNNKLSSYIKFMISLETLFTRDRNAGKLTEHLAKCVAIMSGTNLSETESIYNEMKRNKGMYDLRSIVVHQGEIININLEKLARWASYSFIGVLGFANEGYTTKRQVFLEIERLAKMIEMQQSKKWYLTLNYVVKKLLSWKIC